MDKLVKQVTVIRGSDNNRERVIIYDKKKSRKTTVWLRPLERTIRRLLKAEVILTQEGYRRHLKSRDQRRDGWLLDAPVNVIKARRKAYNDVRKAVPFRLLPKA